MRFSTGSFIGGYFVLGRLGEGTGTAVYRVFDETMGREAALKLMPAQMAGDLERLTGRLRHPCILPVYGWGRVGDQVYMVTELLEGGTLKLRLGAPMSVEDAVRVLSPLAAALDYAHQQGIVHGAVRPENIRLTMYGGPILAGFELVDISGRPEYMSPERCAGDPPSPSGDIYSLGIVAYEMLTGRTPFQSDSPAAVAQGHLSLPVPSTGLPDQVESALLRALAKTSTVRFPTATEFVDRLAGKAPGNAAAKAAPAARRGLLARLRLAG